jgi:hypothetical protein
LGRGAADSKEKHHEESSSRVDGGSGARIRGIRSQRGPANHQPVSDCLNVKVAGSGAWSFGPDREASLAIGCDNAGGGNPFNGALDEVKLYDTVLTPAEILALAGK